MSRCIDHGMYGVGLGYAYKYINGKRHRWHRMIYCMKVGYTIESIKGLVVRHTCDNARCINPEHLIIGTHADNMRDAVERNRNAKGIRNGHAKLTPDIVKYCREVYKPYDPEFGGAALARKFGVDCTTLHDAIRGDTWRD